MRFKLDSRGRHGGRGGSRGLVARSGAVAGEAEDEAGEREGHDELIVDTPEYGRRRGCDFVLRRSILNFRDFVGLVEREQAVEDETDKNRPENGFEVNSAHVFYLAQFFFGCELRRLM